MPGRGGSAAREAEWIVELLRVCEQELAWLSTARRVVGELPVVAHAVTSPVCPEVPAQRSDSGRETVEPSRGKARSVNAAATRSTPKGSQSINLRSNTRPEQGCQDLQHTTYSSASPK
jgi:hypothetical protein